MMIKVENSNAGGYSIWDGFSKISIYEAEKTIEPTLEEEDGDDSKVEVPPEHRGRDGVFLFNPPGYGANYSRLIHGTKMMLAEPPDFDISSHGEPNDKNDVIVFHGWLAFCEKPDGGIVDIFFNTRGYLLNDSGKTVEVLKSKQVFR